MTNDQLRKLSKMKQLINKGHRRFIYRRDRNYIQDLLNIGITENQAWQEVLTLSAYDYSIDYRPFYNKQGEDALTFKKKINGKCVYIKLKIEEYNIEETTVCLSFHIDRN